MSSFRLDIEKSLRGTQFRQWASNRLKDYLIKGYAINKKRLQQTNQEIKILRSGIQIIGRAIDSAPPEYPFIHTLPHNLLTNLSFLSIFNG